MSRTISILGTAVKQLLGALFVFSALSKFVALDQFNVYVFSFGFVSLNLSILAGWAVVSFEMLLGVAMISNRYHRWVSWANIGMLLLFSIFLLYALLSGRTDSCHCMGEMLPFNPLQSLLKNVVLLALSLFSLRYVDEEWRPRWWLSLVVVVLPVAIFALGAFLGWTRMTVIDFQYSMIFAAAAFVMAVLASFRFSDRVLLQILLALVPFVMVMVLDTYASLFMHKGTTRFNRDLFEEVLRTDDQLEGCELGKGRQLVAIFSPTCPYCHLAAEKLSMIVDRHELSIDRVSVLFPGDSVVAHPDFFEETHSPEYRQLALDVDNYVKVTYGQLPVLVLLEDGKVSATYDHANLSEKAIVEWLSSDQ